MPAPYPTELERRLRLAYRIQKHSAAKRGIPFLLTFEQWSEWWLTDDRWLRRGRKAGQLQMGRKGNSGPYAPDNVECATKEEKQKSQLMAHSFSVTSPEQRAEMARKGGLSRRGEKHWRARPVVTPGAGRTEHHYSDLANEVVRKKPDLILTISSRMVQNFKAATATIPIVGLMTDPVPLGIVDSLARPGGNITGVCSDAGPEILGKRLELLREAVPGISRAGFLASRGVWEGPSGIAVLRPAAERMGVSIIGPPLEGILQEAEYRRVFDAMIQGRPDAVIVSDQVENQWNVRLIVEFAAKNRLPTIYPYREEVEAGGLMAYATDLLNIYRRAAGYVDQILKGAKPGEIPIYLAVKFELVVNVKAAEAIGLTIPPSVLLRADEVIE